MKATLYIAAILLAAAVGNAAPAPTADVMSVRNQEHVPVRSPFADQVKSFDRQNAGIDSFAAEAALNSDRKLLRQNAIKRPFKLPRQNAIRYKSSASEKPLERQDATILPEDVSTEGRPAKLPRKNAIRYKSAATEELHSDTESSQPNAPIKPAFSSEEGQRFREAYHPFEFVPGAPVKPSLNGFQAQAFREAYHEEPVQCTKDLLQLGATEYCTFDDVKKLVESESDLLNDTENPARNTLLMNLAANGRSRGVELLVAKGADVSITNLHGQNALHMGVINGNHQVVKALLSNKSDFVNNADFEGNTPLHFAAFSGNDDVVNELLEKGANANVKNNLGSSALLLALNRGFDSIVNILKEKTDRSILQESKVQLERSLTPLKEKIDQANQELKAVEQELKDCETTLNSDNPRFRDRQQELAALEARCNAQEQHQYMLQQQQQFLQHQADDLQRGIDTINSL